MTPPPQPENDDKLQKIEPFSLAKLQLFQTFSSYCSIKHSKLTSKVQNLVKIKDFTVKSSSYSLAIAVIRGRG